MSTDAMPMPMKSHTRLVLKKPNPIVLSKETGFTRQAMHKLSESGGGRVLTALSPAQDLSSIEMDVETRRMLADTLTSKFLNQYALSATGDEPHRESDEQTERAYKPPRRGKRHRRTFHRLNSLG